MEKADVKKQDTVYMVRCADGSLYTGWTNDLPARLQAHKTGKGARYTRAFRAATLAYAEPVEDKSAGLRREAELKKLSKAEKEALAAEWKKQTAPQFSVAAVRDAAEIAALYGWYVENSTATFQYSPAPTAGEYAVWVRRTGKTAPVLLARDGSGKLLGYACAHPWRTREAYQWDVETTVYCAHDAVGRHTGTLLMQALLEVLKLQGYWNAYAQVTSPNPASSALHKSLGFELQGSCPHCGYKMGKWLGLETWCCQLKKGSKAPEPVNLNPDKAELNRILEKYNRKAVRGDLPKMNRPENPEE